ncbi:LytTR family transcriptional regulator [Antarcticibacterium sp. 1MA-6-2]|uniref:LytTR family DNA-binding domain-containing protein n=1 Tax=Antarcticibacterium sp. 1MA-6-2 TaxID=2908210 RepID=UPI001F3A16E8|nr:LytTR family DNA-binding domain-containing protein [Antarcticibacterium sp. 1MA-6-2]UJH93025.1 LytTR family transcriptional regulator [Antarcticibacterium sp. 1MA-6-2]
MVKTAKENFLSNISLAELDAKLPPNFIRVHKSFILNKEHVKDVQKYFNNRYSIAMTDAAKTVITSGRSYKDKIKEWLFI